MSKKYTKKILFIGNYLSKTRGSKGVIETIIKHINHTKFNYKLCSKHENKFFRFLDFIWFLFFSTYDKIYVDIYSGQAFLFTRLAVFASKVRRKEIIGTLHGGALKEYDQKNKGIVIKIIQKIDRLQSPSKFLIHYFNQKKINVSYLPNPISITNFEYDRSNVTSKTILWVRAFDEIYNPSLAIRIVYELKKDMPDIKLTMIGPDRGILKECIQLIDSLDLKNNIEILGKIPHEKLSFYYQTHDIYLNTTSYESFGNALIEAASCGIPIVSTSVGEIPFSWEHKKNIILVKSFNEKAFSSVLGDLLQNNDLKTSLSLLARKKAEQYDIGKIIPLWDFSNNKSRI
ncbi:MAG: glycosyltransferase involved in cell wall biosynthesis [Urechidicola sp.]|jgi:glycosyltransferase involved in cell wall biosynthesis